MSAVAALARASVSTSHNKHRLSPQTCTGGRQGGAVLLEAQGLLFVWPLQQVRTLCLHPGYQQEMIYHQQETFAVQLSELAAISFCALVCRFLL